MDLVTLAVANALGGNGGGGSSGGVLVVGATFSENENGYVCNKTAAEMWSSAQSGLIIIKDTQSDELWTVFHAYIDSGSYSFKCDSLDFVAESGTDYPTADVG